MKRMSTYQERLAAAKANRPKKEVTVCLDGDVAEQREELLAKIEQAKAEAAQDARLSGPDNSVVTELTERLEALTMAAQDALVVLRFTRLPGAQWAALTSHHPVRADVPIDRHYGYDYDAVCTAAAVASGARIDDGQPVEMAKAEWVELFDVLSGNEVGLIRDAVWELNEFDPAQRIAALVKSSGVTPRSETK